MKNFLKIVSVYVGAYS